VERRYDDFSTVLLGLWYDRHPGVFGRLHQLRGPYYHKMGELDLLEDAIDAGIVSMDELAEVYSLQGVVAGVEGRGAEARQVLLAVTVSSVIAIGVVRAAEQGAAILRKAGYIAHPVVGGYAVEEEALRQLKEQGIRYHVRPDEYATEAG
jgi:hypothetical protein